MSLLRIKSSQRSAGKLKLSDRCRVTTAGVRFGKLKVEDAAALIKRWEERNRTDRTILETLIHNNLNQQIRIRTV